MRKFLILCVAGIGLTACSTATVQTDYAALVGLIQTDYPQVVAAAAAYCASPNASADACAKITAAETTTGPLVAALSNTSAPTDITAAFADVNAILPIIAGGPGVSTQTKSDLTTALSILNAVAPIVTGLLPLL